MRITKYSLGQLQANCYFLIENDNCLVVDPADEAGFLMEEIQRQNLKLLGILATHGHFDHVMAAGEIQLSMDTPFYVAEQDMFLIKRLNETAKHFLEYDHQVMIPEDVKYFIGDEFKIGNFKFKIIPTPGHTPGSCCFYFEDNRIIFTGDTLFKNGIGRYDFSYSNKQDLKQSLIKLLKLPKEIIVYPGHGENTTLKNEENLISCLI